MNEAPVSPPRPESPDDRSAGVELLESLLRPARISIPLAGAGVAQSAGLPGSAKIARHLIDRFDLGAEYPTDPVPLPRVLDETLYERGIDAEVSDVVREYVRSWPQGSSSLIENLSRVHSRFVVTFNYEPSIERAAERRHGSGKRRPIGLRNQRSQLPTMSVQGISGTDSRVSGVRFLTASPITTN